MIEGVCIIIIFFFFAQVFRKQKQKRIFLKKTFQTENVSKEEKKNTTKTGVDLILSALDTQVSYLPLADNQNSESALSESEERQQSGKYV